MSSSSSSSPPLSVPGRLPLEISVISRSNTAFTRGRQSDRPMVFRNSDPRLHPFVRAREYTRALQATKLDRVFAKPFVFALDGHRDGVYTMTTLNNSLVHTVTGAMDGQIKCWDLMNQKCVWSATAHVGFVRGLAHLFDVSTLVSVGQDSTVKLWSADIGDDDDANNDDGSLFNSRRGGRQVTMPKSTLTGSSAFTCVSSCFSSNVFATGSGGGGVVELWDPNRSEPIHRFNWGADSINTIAYNKVETNVLASCASDRNTVLYDTRSRQPIRKIIMRMQSNALSWNPYEAYIFTVGSEDHSCYTFDVRSLSRALCVHSDHVSAVMSVDYAPTGKEFVTGGYDRTVRIWKSGEGHSREVYHTRRMQRVFCTRFSLDAKYVLSCSDDANVRCWKANASDKLGVTSVRDMNARNYRSALMNKFSATPEVRRIARHRHLPSAILKARKMRHVINSASKVKEERRRAHTKPENRPAREDAKQKAVLKEEK